MPVAGSSALFDFIGKQEKPAGSSALFDFIGKQEKPAGSSALFDFIGKQEKPAGSSTLFDTVGNFIFNRGIRGPQFKQKTISDDRFSNRLTTVFSIVYINLKNTGVTTLYTVPSGNTLIVNGIIFRATQDPAITDATVSVGVNPSTTNLFDEQQLVQFRNINDVWSLWSDKSTTLVAQAGEQIDLSVTTAATGGSLEAHAYLVGFLI